MARTPNLKTLPTSSIRWNRAAQRYINPQGKFVSQARLEVVLEQNIQAIAGKMDDLMHDLVQVGPSGIDLWERQQRRLVKDLHLQNAALAEGGFHNITQSGYGRAGYQIRYNNARIAKFAQEMRSNPELLTKEKYLRRRAALYSANGRFTYEWVKQNAHKRNGFRYVENILELGVNHCTSTGETVGCVEMTERGRVPVDEYVLTGDRSCGPMCQCRSRYYKTLKAE